MEIETLLRRRGFEGMSPKRRREVASLGGKAAHKSGNAHRWTSEEAQRAGKVGGRISKRRKRALSGN
jgi:general stress protein YciG